ncbi:MAG: phospho-N-acetylmuramoyl-pentapeptide-transferase [Planctomycetota bacterium]
MLLWLIQQLSGDWCKSVMAGIDVAGLLRITPRSGIAAILSFLVAVLTGPRWIAWLRRHFRERISSASAEVERLHRAKESTPTMGGMFIVAGVFLAGILLSDLGNPFVLAAMLLTGSLAAVGAADDLIKLRGDSRGLSARAKLLGQFVATAAPAVLLYHGLQGAAGGCDLQVPFFGSLGSLGVWFIPWAVLVMVAVSNAVNITDGLDGLAGGCLVFATAGALILVYAAGHSELAAYLHVASVPGAGEVTVLAAAMIGAVLGFLWFNCHPAQVFMGDTGSLPLGGLLALLALVARQEVLLLLLGGVFTAEAGSVVLQVLYHRFRKRRIFLCAPLHHHYQFRGVPENRIVVRFWIASALCALMALVAVRFTSPEFVPPAPPATEIAAIPAAPLR